MAIRQKIFIFMITMALTGLVGCSPFKKTKTLAVCPGSKTLTRSLNLITSQGANVTPFRISSARCRWVQLENGRKTQDENFPVKIWVSPPDKIRVQGDIAFDPTALILGSNEQQFWLALKPKEISSYYWGTWQQQTARQKLILSPKTLLEAFALIDIENKRLWSLTNNGPYDILSKSGKATPAKKIYIYNCKNEISKIQYLNPQRQIIAETSLEKYKKVKEDFLIAHKIKITTYLDENTQDTFTFTIKSAKPVELSTLQQKALFEKPDQKGYRHIYKSEFGKFPEQ